MAALTWCDDVRISQLRTLGAASTAITVRQIAFGAALSLSLNTFFATDGASAATRADGPRRVKNGHFTAHTADIGKIAHASSLGTVPLSVKKK